MIGCQIDMRKCVNRHYLIGPQTWRLSPLVLVAVFYTTAGRLLLDHFITSACFVTGKKHCAWNDAPLVVMATAMPRDLASVIKAGLELIVQMLCIRHGCIFA